MLIKANELKAAMSVYPETVSEAADWCILRDLLLSVVNDGAVYAAIRTGYMPTVYTALRKFEQRWAAMYAADDIAVAITVECKPLLIDYITAYFTED